MEANVVITSCHIYCGVFRGVKQLIKSGYILLKLSLIHPLTFIEQVTFDPNVCFNKWPVTYWIVYAYPTQKQPLV